MSLEKSMRDLEYFSKTKVPNDMWVIIRLDGNKFSKFTKERNFEKPFDINFINYMKETALYVTEKMGGVYTSTHSDEISMLFRPDWDFFNKRIEKLTSISASFASSKFTHLTGFPVQFDSRIWMSPKNSEVLRYFQWRQHDAKRNALHGLCFWKLIEEKNSPNKATSILNNADDTWKHDFLYERGINFNDIEIWKKRGISIYWEKYLKEGFNPITKQTVTAVRRKLTVDFETPMKDEYNQFLERILSEGCS